MKLSIERIEEQKGFISKKSVYIIVVDLSFSDEEKALITKHKWKDYALLTYTKYDGTSVKDNVSCFLDEPVRRSWSEVEHRIIYESNLIAGVKEFKALLAGISAGAVSGKTEIEI